MDELIVGPEAAGERLDLALAREAGSRSAAQRLIDQGCVTVDGVQRPKRWVVSEGERIAVTRPEPPLSSEGCTAAEIEIVHRDDELLVVDKAAGIVVHPAPGHRTGTLAQALEGLAGGGEPGRVGIVHRLDRETSGLLVVARNEVALRRLRAALQRREIERHYSALVIGRPKSREGVIDAAIGRDRRDRTRMSLQSDTPRQARTRFCVAESLSDSCLLDVTLDTGRTHQIRVHLQSIGLPVAGDPTYGAPGAFGLSRQFLHARRLVLPHPSTGETIDVTSRLPADLQAALDRARRGETP